MTEPPAPVSAARAMTLVDTANSVFSPNARRTDGIAPNTGTAYSTAERRERERSRENMTDSEGRAER